MSLIYKTVFGLLVIALAVGGEVRLSLAADAGEGIIMVQDDGFEIRPPGADEGGGVPDPGADTDRPSEDGTARGPDDLNPDGPEAEAPGLDGPEFETPGCPLRDGPLELLV